MCSVHGEFYPKIQISKQKVEFLFLSETSKKKQITFLAEISPKKMFQNMFFSSFFVIKIYTWKKSCIIFFFIHRAYALCIKKNIYMGFSCINLYMAENQKKRYARGSQVVKKAPPGMV